MYDDVFSRLSFLNRDVNTYTDFFCMNSINMVF